MKLVSLLVGFLFKEGTLGSLAGGLGGGGGLASLAGSFSSKPGDAMKFAPVLMKYVNGKGATQAASLLSNVLK